jgi:hypothetical protein
MAMIELTISELPLVAGGDAGAMIVVDDGTVAFNGTLVSEPSFSSAVLNATGSVDKNGEFEASFQVFANSGLPED